jgi:hypothetical protein
MVRPGWLVYLSQAHHQQMRDADSRHMPGAHYNHPQPSFPKGGRFSPLFFKEGQGKFLLAYITSRFLQTASLCQTFLSLTGQTSGLPILS